MKPFLSLLFLSLSFTSAGLADTTPVTCRLMHLQVQPHKNEPLYTGSDDSAIRCDIPSEELSKPIILPSSKGQIIFSKQTGQATNPVAIAKIPNGVKNAILLFLKSNQTEEKPSYKIIVIDYSTNKAPKNGSFVFNASSNQLRFLIGNQQGYAKSGQVTSVARPKERDAFQMSRVMFQTQSNKTWKTSYESMMRFPERTHRLFVAYKDPRTEQPSLRILRFTPK